MRRAVGLSIAAVVLSVTLGVLIGLVIHTGMSERADHSGGRPGTSVPVTGASDAGSLSDTTSDPSGGQAGQSVPPFTDPWPAEVTPVTEPPTDGTDGADGAEAVNAGQSTSTRADALAASTTTVTSTPSGRTAGRTPSTGTRTSASGHARASGTPSTLRTPTIISSTVGGSSGMGTSSRTATTGGHGRTSISSTDSGDTLRSTGASAPVTADTGTDRPDRPCGTLGEKSAMRSGATLFCQHDQTDGSLRWRAVTNGGGCLNQTMTGTGLDGHRYACRLGTGGLNHWKRAG